MDISQLLSILYPPGQSRQLTTLQENVVRHPQGPAWVLAGPGSGKTEVLTVMVLRLLYVDDDPIQPARVPPESILVTTFTEKAARNLEDRIAGMRARLIAANSVLDAIDISKLRIGTLHGLCNDLLQEFRAPNYQNVRLMDEFEQALFVREHMSSIKQSNQSQELTFWQFFPWLFKPNEWKATYSNPPNKWQATKKLVTLLNRLVEDHVSIPGIRAAGGQRARLADLYEEYLQHLQNNFRCDFAQLQARFLDFLGTSLGGVFIDGDESSQYPGIQWVLVDEYQDTNLVQEAVYFELGRRSPHNLVVVGDDDQAMYRFRGGSVECMVTFDDACQAFWGIPSTQVQQYPLVDNFRSHGNIVQFFNEFIAAFPVMQLPGSRAPKSAIVPRKQITQNYPAVGTITGQTIADLANRFADTVSGLVVNGIVNDPNECCLLLKSTKESPRNAEPYVRTLLARGLPVYNPRNKAFMDQEEVQGLLGSLLAILDPARRFAQDPANANFIPPAENAIRVTYDSLAAAFSPLADYVTDATAAIRAKPGQYFTCELQELVYYLLSVEPFSTWELDPVRRIRLAKLTKLLEAYASMPILDLSTGLPRPNVNRGLLRASSSNPGEVYELWLRSFYSLFLGYVTQTGFDDEEVEEEICPPGMIPVMTMHQAKGLEFPFVFVGHMGEKPSISASHQLETLFSSYPANSARSFVRQPAGVRAEMDLIRQYYVAYSRAKYALILLGTRSQFSNASTPLGPTSNWYRQRTFPL